MEVEPRLQPLNNKRLNLRSAITSSEARLDMKAGGFWLRGVTTFFDARVTDVNSVTRASQGRIPSKSKRMRRSENTNREN